MSLESFKMDNIIKEMSKSNVEKVIIVILMLPDDDNDFYYQSHLTVVKSIDGNDKNMVYNVPTRFKNYDINECIEDTFYFTVSLFGLVSKNVYVFDGESYKEIREIEYTESEIAEIVESYESDDDDFSEDPHNDDSPEIYLSGVYINKEKALEVFESEPIPINRTIH